jgi:hypothetical protein
MLLPNMGAFAERAVLSLSACLPADAHFHASRSWPWRASWHVRFKHPITASREERIQVSLDASDGYRHHFAKTVAVGATPEALFAYVDDHERLASHMMRSSMMMAGNRMELSFDDKQGRAVGAVIRMSGRMLGLHLDLEEVVTERIVPERKAWETICTPRLYVIGHYRMGFSMSPQDGGSAFTVFIDYDRP